jgi:hypothetical protein
MGIVGTEHSVSMRLAQRPGLSSAAGSCSLQTAGKSHIQQDLAGAVTCT